MKARRLLFGSLFVTAGILAGVHGCNTYDTSLLVGDPVEQPPTKSGIGWWSKTDARGCFSAGKPGPEHRPSAGGDKDVGPITMAVASMRLGARSEKGVFDPNAWQDIGFDIDGVCTASETCTSEDPPPSCKAGASQLPRDGRYCRDNTFGKLAYSAELIPQLSKVYGLSDDAFNCALCVGAYSFLVRVTGYNGEPDDAHVRVDMYPSPGLEKPLPWDCSQPTWKSQPCFSPDMPWTVQDDVLAEKRGGPDLPDSKIFDDQAFVRDGYLVMDLPEDTLFWFPGYKGLVVAFPLKVQKGAVVAKLAKGADNVWTLSDGVIAGRTRSNDILRAFRLIGLCEESDADTYDLMRTFVSDNLDVLGDGRSDPDSPCDAMSLGIAFTARQARAGRTEAVAPPVECVRANAGADAGADAAASSTRARSPRP